MLPSVPPDAASAVDILAQLKARGFFQQVNDEEGLSRSLRDGRVTFYVGFDPTAPSLHVGNMIPLMAMALLARAGHRPIAVLGGGTAMIGDPSGKTEMRQMMSEETIRQNRDRIEPQIRRFLDVAPDAVVVDNAEWLLKLRYLDFLGEIGAQFSVNRMLAAEAYKQRLERDLSFIEFNYQILQAYDFLALNKRYECVLQMGGDDQWGNILAGTDLIRRVTQRSAFALTFPLILTASGAKMGKTASGAVWLAADRTDPAQFHQYFLNTDDRDVIRFLNLFTFLPVSEILRLEREHGSNLKPLKEILAREATAIVHGPTSAAAPTSVPDLRSRSSDRHS